jgi:PAS domain S-box-containing protein
MNNKIRVLIVEDESIVGIDLKQTLIKLNYQVLDVVRTGEDAIKKAIENKPDVILMDIMLGGRITGIEAVQRIKENIDVPVIYLTAYADDKTIQSAKLTDPFGYLLKPFDERSLHSSIEMALYKHETNSSLKKSEERYRALVELSPIAIGIHSEGKVVYVNSAGIKLFGANSEKELIGKPIMDLVLPSFRDLVQERVKRATSRKENLEAIEEKLMRLDGEELDVEVSAIPTEFAGKDAVQVVIRDISEVKKKERIHQATVKILQSVNLSRSLDQQYSYLHKTLMDFIEIKNVCFAFYDKKNNRISFPYFNDEFDEIPQTRHFGNGLIEHTIKSARIQLLNKETIENLIKTKTLIFNEKMPKIWMGVPLPLDENLTLVLVFKEYISEHYLSEKELDLINSISLPLTRAIERKMIEEDKKDTLEKLEELNQTKDNFFSIISHDLRSPFDSILGFTEVLKNDLEELTKEELKLYLDSLYHSSRHIYSLLNNLLQYSRFQLGKIEFEQKTLNLKKIIEKNLEMLGGSVLKKELKMINQLKDDILVFADEDMLNSILLNLVTNAIKFSKRGGEITVSADCQNGYANISIKDTGVGMDELTLKKIFKLDAKKSTPGTENETGTGLGLLIVKEFIEKHEGTIKVTSQPSKGSIFSFTLPLASISPTSK